VDILLVLDGATNNTVQLQAHFARQILDPDLVPIAAHIRTAVYVIESDAGFFVDFNDTVRTLSADEPTVNVGINATESVADMITTLNTFSSTVRKSVVAIVFDSNGATSIAVEQAALDNLPTRLPVVTVSVPATATRADAVSFLSGAMTADLRAALCRQSQNPIVLNPLPSVLAPGGRIFQYGIPLDTFWDEEYNFDLPILLHWSNRASTSASTASLPPWLSYDNISRTLVGVPSSTSSEVVQLQVWAANERLRSPAELLYITVVPNADDGRLLPPVVVNFTGTLLSNPVVPTPRRSRQRQRRQTAPSNCTGQPDGFQRVAAMHAVANATGEPVSNVLLVSAIPQDGTCAYDASFVVDATCDGREGVRDDLEQNGATEIEAALNSPIQYGNQR
jgi:hypothetical protein